jgi:hypothetical protein
MRATKWFHYYHPYLVIFALIVFGIPRISHSATVTVEFGGTTIIDYVPYLDSAWGERYPDFFDGIYSQIGTSTGFVGHITYDTSAVDQYPLQPNFGQYSFMGPPASFSIEIMTSDAQVLTFSQDFSVAPINISVSPYDSGGQFFFHARGSEATQPFAVEGVNSIGFELNEMPFTSDALPESLDINPWGLGFAYLIMNDGLGMYEVDMYPTYFSLSTTAVPVPASVWLFVSGVISLCGFLKRNRSSC